MSSEESAYKVKNRKQGGFGAYRELVYGDQSFGRVVLGGLGAYRELVSGDQSFGRVVLGELLTLLIGGLPGALGLLLRMKLYPLLFREIGRKVIFGRNITIRHSHKIRIGDNVVIDDNAVIDAKGAGNRGIDLGEGVYIGRNSIVYCKGGDITLEPRVNLSSNCQVFSSNALMIGAGTMIGAYSYMLSGGEYDHESKVPFAEQDGMETKGPLTVGSNCWFGARVTVLDGACIGENSVIAAGAVVTRPLPAGSLAGGVPARSLRK